MEKLKNRTNKKFYPVKIINNDNFSHKTIFTSPNLPELFNNINDRKLYQIGIFDKFLIKDIIPDYSNLVKEIRDKDNKVRRYFNVKNTIFKKMTTKNSLTYKFYLKGFGLYFFGPDGIVTKNYKDLKNYYEERLKNLQLLNRIFAGSLDYYSLVPGSDNYLRRLKSNEKNYLINSNNLMVINNDFEKIKRNILKRKKKTKNFININIKKIKQYESLQKIHLDKKIEERTLKTDKFLKKNRKKLIKLDLNKLIKRNLFTSKKIDESKIKCLFTASNRDKILKNLDRNKIRDKVIENNNLFLKTNSLHFANKSEDKNLYMLNNNKHNSNTLFSFNKKVKKILQKEIDSIYSSSNDSQKKIKYCNKISYESFYEKKPIIVVKDQDMFEDIKDESNNNEL